MLASTAQFNVKMLKKLCATMNASINRSKIAYAEYGWLISPFFEWNSTVLIIRLVQLQFQRTVMLSFIHSISYATF